MPRRAWRRRRRSSRRWATSTSTVDLAPGAALALLSLLAACGHDASAPSKPPPRPHIVRTVAHPFLRRTYRPDRDLLGAADVLDLRYDALHADAAARVDHDKVIVDLGRMDSTLVESVDAVALWRGRFELRREVHDDPHDAALSLIMSYVAADHGAARWGIRIDHGTLVAEDLGDRDARKLASYVAALPAGVRLPSDRALVYEHTTIHPIGPAWRAHEVAEPLIDDGAELTVRIKPSGDVYLDLDDAHAQQYAARLADLPPSTWVALILDGQYLGSIAPADGDALHFHEDYDGRRAELAAVLASGPLPSPMTQLTVEGVP
jgi:hypothetical protein